MKSFAFVQLDRHCFPLRVIERNGTRVAVDDDNCMMPSLLSFHSFIG